MISSTITSDRAENQPKLSICIATYNRADFIGATLESIIPQINDEVEVLVVDGASTDNTAIVIDKFTRSHNQIKYIQLPSKGGVDQDYCKAVEFAHGEMCWLFTDDDIIKADAISRILFEIKKGYSLIVVNAEVKTIDLSKVISKSQLKIKNDRIFLKSELDNLFRCVIPYLSFIGGVIINRNLWLQRNKEIYFGSEFIHVGVIFQEPLPGEVLVISEPYITIRLGNAQWTPRAFKIWIINWPTLLCSFQHLSQQSKKRYKQTPSVMNLRDLIVKRAESSFFSKEYSLWLKFSHDQPLWWKLIVKLINLLPIRIAKFIVYSYVSVNKKFH